MTLLEWLENWVTTNYGKENVDCFDLKKLVKDMRKVFDIQKHE